MRVYTAAHVHYTYILLYTRVYIYILLLCAYIRGRTHANGLCLTGDDLRDTHETHVYILSLRRIYVIILEEMK